MRHRDSLCCNCDILPAELAILCRAHGDYLLQEPGLTRLPLQETSKKRTRRTVKHQRAIVGASLDVIKERRSMRPEARSAARAAAIKEGKEKKAAAESAKKAEKAKNAARAAQGQAQKVSKQGAKGAAPKVQARTR
jgi:large subunit ribosomal protein L24e